MSKIVGEGEESMVLPGFRFHPTDTELVEYYLQRKVQKRPLTIDFIKQVDIYKYDPWDLPKEGGLGEREWYFFCKRGRKYKNSCRPNRVTASGFWKATGIDKPIYSSSYSSSVPPREACIGLKKSLVYYRGCAGKGTKTQWMMHEFRLPLHHSPSPIEAEVWTLCRILKRSDGCSRRYERGGGGGGGEESGTGKIQAETSSSSSGREYGYWWWDELKAMTMVNPLNP